MKCSLIAFLLVALMNCSLCLSTNLNEFIGSLEREPYFKQASLGIYVISEKEKKVIVNHHGEKSLLPNSILKLITTAAALKLLGEQFQFRTQLIGVGKIQDHILEGDLVILGSGDPTLGSHRFNDQKQLETWALSLKKEGIKKVKGSIIGDASCFEKALSPATWLWEDLGNYYGAGASGLNFHENFYNVFFKLGQKIGDAACIDKIEPAIPHLNIINEVSSAAKGTGDKAYVFGGEFSTTQYIRGTLPLDHPTFKIKGCIPNPPEFCAESLRRFLEKQGIAVEGKSKASFDETLFSEKMLFNERLSPQLSEIVFLANKFSLNLYCESLLKKMGEIKKHKGTHLAGLEVIQDYLQGMDLSLEGFNILDGSGLSSRNLVTAKGFVEFLLKVSQESYFPVLFRSLPSYQELQRTFSNRMFSERIFAKSGYSSQGESFAGFLINNKGERLLFCILCNNFLGPSSVFRKKMERFFELLLVD